MEVCKAYKVRLYPNKAQEQKMLQTIGACRFIYNYFLAARKGYYVEYGKTLPYAQMGRDLTVLRNSIWWLSQVHAEPVHQSLRRLDRTYQRFFKNKRGFPHFKNKKDAKQSFQKHIDWRVVGNKIRIQKDLVVKYRGTIDSAAKLGTLIVSYSAGKWYASITAKIDLKQPVRRTKPVGIDVGLETLVTLSTGQKFANIQPQKINQARLTCASRVLARRQIGSKRREKARLALARVHEKIANVRKNHLHQISSAITAKNHSLIAVEDLNVRGMVRNRNLARAISDAGWSEFLRQVQYKQEWKGGEFVKVDRYFPSSKTCNVCGFLSETMPLNVRKWKCGSCNTSHDRDVNAAKNIVKEALAYRVRGVDVRLSKQSTVKRGRVSA